VSDDLIGRPVNAVLVPRQAERFASIAGVDLDGLVLNVTGWNKLVLLDRDRAFLFPRTAENVEWLERSRRCWSTATSTKTNCWPRVAC
jgi:hypothetical protein